MGKIVPFRKTGGAAKPDDTARSVKKGFGNARKSLEQLCDADFDRSGIPRAVRRSLGISTHDADSAWAQLHPKNPDARPRTCTASAFKFPYFGPEGGQIPFFRMRKLQGRWGEKDDGQDRYRGPANSLPHLYVPVPLLARLGIDWDPKTRRFVGVKRLVLCEGEKKAIKACLCDIPAVGLGGVTSYGSARHNIDLLEEFDWFDWSKIDVEVCHDSDTYTNPDVRRAMYRLGYVLRREKHPKSVGYRRLTSEHDAKTGLDDLLASCDTPEQARRRYESIPLETDRIAEAFEHFNAEIAQVRKKTRYYNVVTRTFYQSQQKVAEEYGVGPMVLGPDGKKPVLPISLWFTERPPNITTVTDVVYVPGKPERFLLDPKDDFVTLNEWRPSGLEPIPYTKRDTKLLRPLFEFIDYLTPELTDAQRAWFLDWLAYPLQHPGGKLATAVCAVSEANGTGKNTVVNILRPMYGDHNVMEINGSTLASQYNEWALRQFVSIAEVRVPSFAERMAVMARLKMLITDPRIDLDRKYLPRENVPNYVNLYLTSNHQNALLLDDDDRRFFVFRGPPKEHKWTDRQFAEFYGWLKDGGIPRTYGYLLARDLKHFNPHSQAPRTAAREAMIQHSHSVMDDLADILVITPAKVLTTLTDEGARKIKLVDLFTAAQLVEYLGAYTKHHNIRTPPITTQMLGQALGKRNVTRREFEIKGGRKITAYALFNADKWKTRDNAEWRQYVMERNKQEFSR